MTDKEIDLTIRNFKSLKESSIKLGEFNVIIGPNGSGKTNLLEAFRFLQRALIERSSPHIPYLQWWNWRNVVWKGQEDLPVSFSIKIEKFGRPIEYEIDFNGSGGTFRILRENFEIRDLVHIERIGTKGKYRIDPGFIDENWEKFKEYLAQGMFEHNDKKYFKGDFEFTVREQTSLLFRFSNSMWHFWEGPGPEGAWSLGTFLLDSKNKIPVISPSIPDPRFGPDGKYSLVQSCIGGLIQLFGAMTYINHLNFKELESPQPMKKESQLEDDGRNLINVMYNMFLANEGRLPDRIESAMRLHFPGMQLQFELTQDARVFIKLREGGYEVSPPGMPDGLFKMLMILTAIETKGSDLILMDEVENSLHAKLLEYLVDELKNSGKTVIVTTHSPYLVDIAELTDIIVAKRTEGTTFERIKEPKLLREELRKAGLTQSESWLYGDR